MNHNKQVVIKKMGRIPNPDREDSNYMVLAIF